MASSIAAATIASSGRDAWKTATVVCGIVALALGGAAIYLITRPAATTGAVTRFQVSPPEKTTFVIATGRQDGNNSGALSPDGTRLVFAAADASGAAQLWIRSLDSFAARPRPGTDNGSFPFWSPDSRFIGFFVQGRLRKIDANER